MNGDYLISLVRMQHPASHWHMARAKKRTVGGYISAAIKHDCMFPQPCFPRRDRAEALSMSIQVKYLHPPPIIFSYGHPTLTPSFPDFGDLRPLISGRFAGEEATYPLETELKVKCVVTVKREVLVCLTRISTDH